jgi:hypothetical protein
MDWVTSCLLQKKSNSRNVWVIASCGVICLRPVKYEMLHLDILTEKKWGFSCCCGFCSCPSRVKNQSNCLIACCLGTSSEFRETTIRFVMHVCPSARLSALNNWTDFHEIWYLSFFQKSVQKIQVWLKCIEKKGDFTWRCACVYDNISLNSS